MSTFILAISYLTTSNLPWFMDLTFQVSMQYCFLQHWSLLPSPVTSTTGWWCCFGSISSFFLELFLHWSPAAYWAPTDLGSSSFSVLRFCLFILFMGFSRQEYWFAITNEKQEADPYFLDPPHWLTLDFLQIWKADSVEAAGTTFFGHIWEKTAELVSERFTARVRGYLDPPCLFPSSPFNPEGRGQ